jgi:hypothetical protein
MPLIVDGLGLDEFSFGGFNYSLLLLAQIRAVYDVIYTLLSATKAVFLSTISKQSTRQPFSGWPA